MLMVVEQSSLPKLNYQNILISHNIKKYWKNNHQLYQYK